MRYECSFSNVNDSGELVEETIAIHGELSELIVSNKSTSNVSPDEHLDGEFEDVVKIVWQVHLYPIIQSYYMNYLISLKLVPNHASSPLIKEKFDHNSLLTIRSLSVAPSVIKKDQRPHVAKTVIKSKPLADRPISSSISKILIVKGASSAPAPKSKTLGQSTKNVLSVSKSRVGTNKAQEKVSLLVINSKSK